MSLINDFLSNKKLIRSKRDLLIRVPLGIFGCLFLAASPLIVAYTGAAITELLTGQQCLNEGSCFWAAIPWLCLVSFPAAGGLCILFLIKALRQTPDVFRKNDGMKK